MFVYFDGNHQNLRHQIREGIANVFLNSMFANTSLQDIVKSTINLGLPEWYSEGLVEYIASSWNHLIDDELRDLWTRSKKKYYRFDKLAEDHPRVAGHSFWYFIDQKYDQSSISNILYLVRINRDVEDSFLYVLGVSLDQLIADWEVFYENKFEAEKGKFGDMNEDNLLKLANRPEVPISQLSISPDGNYLAYTYNQLGKLRVKVRDLRTGEEKTVFKYGYKNNIQETDYNYCIIAWHPKGGEISILYEHRDRMYLRKIDLSSEDFVEQIIPEELQRVYTLSYKNDFDYIMSASADGFSDLFEYQTKGRSFTRITDDHHDDLDAHYTRYKGQEGILFSSNRRSTVLRREKIDTILPIDNFDIYFLPYSREKGELIQLTNIKKANCRYPFINADDQIIYLSDQSGIINRYLYDENKHHALSNLDRNIIRHHCSPTDNMHIFTLYDDGDYVVYAGQVDWNKPVGSHTTKWKRQVELSSEIDTTIGIGVLNMPVEQPQIQGEEYLFQSKFPDPEYIEPLEDRNVSIDNSVINRPSNSKEKEVQKFVSARAVAARTTFKIEEFATRLDNEVLFEGLQSFTGSQTDFANTPVGILFKAKVKDLFEDYIIQGGVRIPTSFNGNEVFLTLDDNKSLLDKRFALYRKSQSRTIPDFIFPSQKEKNTTLLGMYRLKYPFDVYRSLRGTAQLRLDKYYLLSSEEQSSSAPELSEQRVSIKGEYVYDNTLDYDLNIKHGSRYKFYVEFINKFDFNTRGGINFDATTGFTSVIGYDARHYIPFLKHSILALRTAGATSFGNERMLYYLGGVENWIGSQYDQNIPIPQGRSFAFQTIAANLRGFNTNARNGGTYVLGNAELRIPFMKYLLGHDLRSSFLRSLQLTAFYDVGMAWHGLSPTGDENPLNTEIIDQSPQLVITINYFRDPLVMGYGLGLRSNFFGYFLKFDYAWGVESRTVLDPKFYFSIGYDF